jgi:hypothetical protein
MRVRGRIEAAQSVALPSSARRKACQYALTLSAENVKDSPLNRNVERKTLFPGFPATRTRRGATAGTLQTACGRSAKPVYPNLRYRLLLSSAEMAKTALEAYEHCVVVVFWIKKCLKGDTVILRRSESHEHQSAAKSQPR